MFDFFAFPVNCLLLLLVLFCFIFFADCRKLHMYSWNIDFVCASCVCFAGSQWAGCSKCEILVSAEEAMWGAGTAQTQWSCTEDETHYQSHLHHLGQQPPLQQQWEDQWSCPNGCCFSFILSTITTIPSVRLLKPGEKVTMGLCGPILQVTNEIIRLCTQSISLDQIFEGYVSSSKRILNDCIWCCQSWRETYCRASQIQQKYQKLQHF